MKMIDIPFREDEELFSSLQELYNGIGQEALFLSHYDLAERTGESPIAWKQFLMDPRVSAFIAEEFFRSIETTSAINRSQVGEVYGEKLSIQDFQNLVDEQIEFRKLQKQMQGQEGTLTDSETEQIREQVWQQFVSSKIIEHEADKLGLFVTDGEVQAAPAYYTHLPAHETVLDLVCRLLLEKKKKPQAH